MDVFFDTVMGKPLWMWAAFLSIVVALLVLDLGVLHRKTKEIGVRESLVMSAFYIAIALAFGGWVWHALGAEAGQNYITGFIVEKTLALDNIFVISLIFTYFAVPREYQHRVLFWGIIGAIVFRALFISAGAALVNSWTWVLYFFAAFLIWTGWRMMSGAEHDLKLEDN
jgi:tellurite resistance protein TerC